MNEQNNINICISCNRDESIVPLVSITFSQNSTWICTQCLPTLIHDPQRLSNKFKDMTTENPPEPLN